MSLKQSIVVVNEYTIKTGSKGGTRGGTPGDYILRYMARDGATENITPSTRFDADTYIVKYMARESAVENLGSVPEIKDAMYNAQGLGGVAFGYGSVALSEEGLKSAVDDIKRSFQKGKTVLKTVLSFDEPYLREHGLLDDDFQFERKGDFRGHLDQLKLRYGIMDGINKLGRGYDDLQFVGVIQVDTAHVHCHLAMVDRGVGRLMGDGTQKGKLSSRDKDIIRRGVDDYLDRKQAVKMLSSSVTNDRRNVLCYVKKFTHKTMARQGLPQFLLACLPEDRSLWRASSNRKEMQKANSIVRNYVMKVLETPGSGFDGAMADITKYADHRANREGLSYSKRNKLIRDGQNRLVEDCMNSVYANLRQIPSSELTVRTPMLDMMSMDYQDLSERSDDNDMMLFGFRLRSYSNRLSHHREEYHKYKDEVDYYDSLPDKSQESEALANFLRIEMNYNAMCMTKYQYFLSFIPSDENLEDELEELMRDEEQLRNLEKMRDDPSFKRMKPEVAEDYGIRVYGQFGGRRIKDHPGIISARVSEFEKAFNDRMNAFKDKLHDYGMDYDGESIVRKKRYAFDDVKALDLHHLGYDFSGSMKISDSNRAKFVEMANERYDAYLKARDYLISSGQDSVLDEFAIQDIVLMKQYADRFSKSDALVSQRKGGRNLKRMMGNTVRLGKDYTVDMDMVIRSTVQQTQMDMQDDVFSVDV